MNLMNLRLITFLILFPVLDLLAQNNNHIVHLKPEEWNIQANSYYICGISDKRHDPDNNGKMMSGMSGKVVNIDFDGGLEKALLEFIQSSFTQDTSSIPVWIGIDEFVFKDPGTYMKHTLSLNFKLHYYRIIDGNEIELFQTSGIPLMSARGIPPDMPETIIRQTFKQIAKSFDDWVKANPNQPTLCKGISVNFLSINPEDKSGKNDTILWSSEYKLKWADFQSSPDKKSPFSALSHCLFDYKSVPTFENQMMVLNIRIFACFAKKGSWVQSDKKQDILLSHEQLHFDICELYVRRLRKKISETKFNLLHSDVQFKELFDEAWKSYQDAQNRYDEESEHGLVDEYQKSWATQVRIELDELKEFAKD